MPRSNVMYMVQWEERNPRTGLKMRQKLFRTHRAALSLREALECDGNARNIVLTSKRVVYRVNSHEWNDRERGRIITENFHALEDAKRHAEAEVARGRGVYGIYYGGAGFGLMVPVKWQG